MTQFIVRVELHNADASHYERLHEIMHNAGFGNAILGEDGKAYRLPAAEYHGKSDDAETATSVRVFLQARIATIGVGFLLLVTRAQDIAWYLELA
ncbi:hypothetical protein [Hymenobacter sp.]|uniref:hypothetical protein n=1 Tax=Hymenobacter sp. TaxID=1898978 RepID=UPI00286CF9A8|nr:hypothetical protein [Hymenobacter sp.]